MITKQDAMSADRFHENHEPAGKIFEWRGNGACQTWVTRPDDFRRPIKYGLRSYGQLTPGNAHMFHRADQCPTRHVRVALPPGGDGSWTGIVISQGTGRGATAVVHVTTRGASKYRVGSRVEVPVTLLSDL